MLCGIAGHSVIEYIQLPRPQSEQNTSPGYTRKFKQAGSYPSETVIMAESVLTGHHAPVGVAMLRAHLGKRSWFAMNVSGSVHVGSPTQSCSLRSFQRTSQPAASSSRTTRSSKAGFGETQTNLQPDSPGYLTDSFHMVVPLFSSEAQSEPISLCCQCLLFSLMSLDLGSQYLVLGIQSVNHGLWIIDWHCGPPLWRSSILRPLSGLLSYAIQRRPAR